MIYSTVNHQRGTWAGLICQKYDGVILEWSLKKHIYIQLCLALLEIPNRETYFVSSFSQPITVVGNFLKNYARSQNLMNSTAAEINDSNLFLKIELEYLNEIK